MESFLFLMISVLASGAALVLAIRLVRLRMELWANRRALAVLEKVESKPARRERSLWPVWVLLGLVVLVLWQVLA